MEIDYYLANRRKCHQIICVAMIMVVLHGFEAEGTNSRFFFSPGIGEVLKG